MSIALRLTQYIRETGLSKFNVVTKSDQERSIVAMVDEAVRRSGRSGTAVPEASAVGESASNGRAERTVQSIEDLLRVHTLSFESRIGMKLPCDHAQFLLFILNSSLRALYVSVPSENSRVLESLDGVLSSVLLASKTFIL